MPHPFAIVHDFDRVLHPDFTTTVVCRYNNALLQRFPPDEVAKQLFYKGQLGDSEVPDSVLAEYEKFGIRSREELNALTGKIADEFHTGGGFPDFQSCFSGLVSIARCGEYGMYERPKERGTQIQKGHLVWIKARLNEGVHKDDVERAAREINFIEGAGELVRWGNEIGAYQMLVSDGWDPVIRIGAERLGIRGYVEGTKPEFGGDGRFTGKVGKVDKKAVIHAKLAEAGIPPECAIGIDDSYANAELLTSLGAAIAFYPTPDHRKKFEEISKEKHNLVVWDMPSLCGIPQAIQLWAAAKGYI